MGQLRTSPHFSAPYALNLSVGDPVRLSHPFEYEDNGCRVSIPYGLPGTVEHVYDHSVCRLGGYRVDFGSPYNLVEIDGTYLEHATILPSDPLPEMPLALPPPSGAGLTFEQALADALHEYDVACHELRDNLLSRQIVRAPGIWQQLCNRRDEAAARIWPIKAAWDDAEKTRARINARVAQILTGEEQPPDGDDDIPF